MLKKILIFSLLFLQGCAQMLGKHPRNVSLNPLETVNWATDDNHFI